MVWSPDKPKPGASSTSFAELISRYRAEGQVTVSGVFPKETMDTAIADLGIWTDEFLSTLSEEQRQWYVDSGVTHRTVLRKLDNPHAARAVFKALAVDRRLVSLVEALIGPGVAVAFSQVFVKPPQGGGPKPAHQDNYYFGPNDPDGLVTAWVALDDADHLNGCLSFGRASHRGPLLPHRAPRGRPFDLQIAPSDVDRLDMRPAPVLKGGVSFHHGGTVHRSADNQSNRWRRACAFHYVRHHVVFKSPALTYDNSVLLKVT